MGDTDTGTDTDAASGALEVTAVVDSMGLCPRGSAWTSWPLAVDGWLLTTGCSPLGTAQTSREWQYEQCASTCLHARLSTSCYRRSGRHND